MRKAAKTFTHSGAEDAGAAQRQPKSSPRSHPRRLGYGVPGANERELERISAGFSRSFRSATGLRVALDGTFLEMKINARPIA